MMMGSEKEAAKYTQQDAKRIMQQAYVTFARPTADEAKLKSVSAFSEKVHTTASEHASRLEDLKAGKVYEKNDPRQSREEAAPVLHSAKTFQRKTDHNQQT